MSFIKRNKKTSLIFFGIILFCSILLFRQKTAQIVHAEDTIFDSQQKRISLIDGGISYEVSSGANTVDEFLSQQKITLSEHDAVFPGKDEKINGGTKVIILRAKKITIKEGGNIIHVFTSLNTVEQAIWENKDIKLDDDDITVPSRKALVSDGMTIAVTHVLIKEETKDTNIEYKTVTNEDDTLGWRIKKITQKGGVGIKETKYKVVYNDGKEITRKVLESNITKDPVNEIITQGTYVKTGKASTGAASWYAYTGQMCAANPWLPLGSYVKVTNQDNGKTVVVKINDRGPFGKGRIIDLDKVAFAKIADLGQGMANIKMEVVLN